MSVTTIARAGPAGVCSWLGLPVKPNIEEEKGGRS